MATDNLTRRAKRARHEAEGRAANEIVDWYKAEMARLEADDSLTISERIYAERDVLMEFGRRSKRALAKAKRDNTAPKILEREAREQIDRERGRRS
ncbi:hypothetical protein [Agromyces subbeticus]|uniref:hypothetical protein n=1 Tax=Agromyces subbeticus TaxID=293890 RepID=UPI0003B6067E|nr:hypothetical protein [Agromyces subbeticus]